MPARASTLPVPRPLLALAALLALLASLAVAPATRAATSGDVEVTADITTFVTSLELTLCDTTADFGSGLDAYGSPATSTDTVNGYPDEPLQPNGATYQWIPSCATGESFFKVVSNVSWYSTVCGTAGTYTSSLTLSDLTHSYGAFPACATPTTWTNGGTGTTNYDLVYVLRIEADDTAGSFAATTTWEVIAG